ncbi:hypothetical protein [Nonomuraea sp. C10]|uniref:DUF7662 domain-containing protein n=1 Tax=Nonomuraea sp. C10 TaxID=2600577 RepID=UPI001650C01E|nr:hypothetical protein [Nonomuraea sp. C10]
MPRQFRGAQAGEGVRRDDRDAVRAGSAGLAGHRVGIGGDQQPHPLGDVPVRDVTGPACPLLLALPAAVHLAGEHDWIPGLQAETARAGRIPGRRGQIDMTFAQIAQIVGNDLPPSAFKYPAWWASDPKHTQAVWLDVGYVARPDLGTRQVRFVKA